MSFKKMNEADRVVCRLCGVLFKENNLTHHWHCRHNWRLKPDGSVDERSNPYWSAGGLL